MFTLKNNFNGGSDGTKITAANSGGDSGDAFQTASSTNYTSANATGMRAPLVAVFPDDNGTLAWTGLTLAARTLYVRIYCYLTELPSNAVVQIDAGSGSTVATIRFNSNGTVRLVNRSGVSLATTTSPVSTGQWVRIEAKIVVGTSASNGSCELRLYLNPDSGIPTDAVPASGVDLGTTLPARVMFFNPGFSAFYMDDVAVSDVDWIGTDQLDAEATPDTLTAVWDMPAPAIVLGAGAKPDTLTGAWTLPAPEITTADGLVAINPDPLAGVWVMPAPAVAAFKNALVSVETITGRWDVHDPTAGVPINPGDQITGKGQVEWNGFVFAANTTYIPQKLDGWITDMPGLDSGNVPQPGRHGSYPGRKLAQERHVTLSGLIITDPEEIEQAIEALIQETRVLEDDTELPLAIRLINRVYVGYGSVTRRSIPPDKIGIGQAQYTLQWTLSDPVLLSRELNSAVIVDRTSQTLINAGNAATYPLIRMPGPAANPAIEIKPAGGQERLLEFNLEVPAGQTLIIDAYYGTVRLGGDDQIGSLSDASTAITDLVLPAGPSLVTYDGGGSAPAATVLWRHAYL
ncbi:phage tail family protein [Sphaerimonospora thailandensis]|uniref:phage tail family protein n=1 Tax=Sphaerimonospora thailandensis TaxID=795644 RepID=UPI0019504945|nr:phage tail family protein [Sphaerimonospora thailandensis]